MTNPAERNDIDLSRLFTWGREFELLDRKGESLGVVYIRLVGDADINRARVFALRKSRELRDKLIDLTSDERLAYIPKLENEDKENLAEILLSLNIRELTNSAITDTKVPFPKELKSGATLEQQEKYQKEVDDYPSKREKKVREALEKEIKDLRAELSRRTIEQLLKEYEKTTINQLCENEMLSRFKDACIVFGTYKDLEYKERLFESVEQYDNVLTETKNQLLTFYSSLDIGMDDLKN